MGETSVFNFEVSFVDIRRIFANHAIYWLLLLRMFDREKSERGDSNSRPPRPERGTLPTALLSEWPKTDTKVYKKCDIARWQSVKCIFLPFFLMKCLHGLEKYPTFALANSEEVRTYISMVP